MVIIMCVSPQTSAYFKGTKFSWHGKARFRRRSTHVPNLTEVLSTAKERRLNQFGTAVLIWCGKNVKFDRVCCIIQHWSGR